MHQLFLADFGLFLGRFHPLIVHLPIGFLLLAALLEWWPGEKARPAISFAWVLGALSAVAAAFAGWLLAGESGGGDTLFWHKWLGISVAVLAVLGVFLTKKGGGLAKGYGILVAIMLSVAGHQGGNLTHGETYLFEHAPTVVQKIAGHAPDTTDLRDWSLVNLDSVNLYSAFLQPAINESCAKCHNDQKQNGGLRMDAPHHVFLGGDGGSIVSPGSAMASSWVKRVTLPRENVKAMPPQGEPWDYAEVELLKYWVKEGADTMFVLDPKNTPDEIKELLKRDFGLDLRPRMFVETVRASAIKAPQMEELESMNWAVTSLTPESGAVEAKPAAGKDVTPAGLVKLAEYGAQQVIYLSLNELPFNDADLAPITKFKNLNRLRLNGTNLTEATVAQLKQLKHLESLNLYGTDLDDAIFAHLKDFPKLKRLYLWQTKVTEEAVNTFAANHPQVDIDTGYKSSGAKPDQTESSK